MSPKIADLIELPERVHKGDFVLRLTEGVQRPEATLKEYVVTEQLVGCFQQALDLIRTAVEEGKSKAAYLHGSFGSGKSHFMAVLHLLLQGNPTARGVAELAPVVARHSGWTDGRKFLLLPFHVIGAKGLESAVLGGYVEQVRRLHPTAALPPVYLATALFENARHLRATMGDEAFFTALNRGASDVEAGWGTMAATWNAATFDAAVAAPPRSPDRARLVSDLVERVLTAYRDLARAGEGEAFVSFEEGLSAVSAHAKGLGYDAVILFLDELILWLASHMADTAFVSREIQKVVKLVEAGTGARPVPIVSFIARQRDLRELVGKHLPGAEHLGFDDQLKHWEDRFGRIALDDRNLPSIAQKRVLRPKSEAARMQLAQDFEATTKVRQEVMDVLLPGSATKEAFRKVYPFSPAFIEALVAVSGALQRERTALKVMLELLVQQRDSLELGHIVPVGDLFDVIVEGDEPFADVMKRKFEQAKHLFDSKFLPMLEEEHKRRWEDVRARPANDPECRGFRTDARLVKTLLLSALVPEVEVFRSLTPARLAALNHGTVRSPIAGQEAQLVLSKVRKWAGWVGELRISGDTNPTITVQLLGVDTESVLEKAQSFDNFGNRLQKARELVFQAMGVSLDGGLSPTVEHTIVWRGTARTFDVVFANIRSLPDASLKDLNGQWKVVIDFPFDEENHGPLEDVNRIDRFRDAHPEGAKTICWVPRFFSRKTLEQLGLLVKLDSILAGERFAEASAHLPANERPHARTILTNQRDQLRETIRQALAFAYGLGEPGPDVLDDVVAEEGPIHSLRRDVRVERPATGTLADALTKVLHRVLAQEFPAHPEFLLEEGKAVGSSVAKRVHEEVRRAIPAENHRIVVDKPLRPLMQGVAAPLQLGTYQEGVFVLSPYWKEHFDRQHATEGGQWTVDRLRAWTDRPRPRGLPRLLQNLVILVFAEQTSRSFFRNGAPYPQAGLDDLPEDVELRTQTLPSPAAWDRATEVAAKVLGVAASPLCSSANLQRLGTEVRAAIDGRRDPAQALASRLAELGTRFGLPGNDWTRLATARAVAALVASLASGTEDQVVARLGAAAPATSLEAMGHSFKRTSELRAALDGTPWEVVEAALSLTDERKAAADGLRKQLAEALAQDEFQTSLPPVLARVRADAAALLVPKPPPPKPNPPTPTPPPTPPPAPATWEPVTHRSADLADAATLRKTVADVEAMLAKDPALRVTVRIDVLRRRQGAS